MTENKIIALALGVICIALAASLIIVVANGLFFSDNPNTDNLENQVTSLNVQVTSLQNQVTSLNSAVSEYEEYIEELTDINNYYNSIIALEESAIILDDQTYTQNANTATSLFDDTVYYAGYMKIQVEATSDTTYIQTTYTYENIDYNQKIPVGTNGTATFPVLPGNIEILLGNTDTETNTASITITYFY
ncbi:MAG: hypothetical protein LBC12_00610 [Nitrososphaerota archaeon]|jgi:hypothetical protein|nr:hypothetical protein [Nitrososphaerota archaeon]